MLGNLEVFRRAAPECTAAAEGVADSRCIALWALPVRQPCLHVAPVSARIALKGCDRACLQRFPFFVLRVAVICSCIYEYCLAILLWILCRRFL